MTPFFTILTHYGKTALAEALAAQQPLAIPHMAVGDGGGEYYEPTETQTNLRNEQWRGELNDLRTDEELQGQVIAEAIIPHGIDGDWTAREIGLFDAKGGLIAVGKYPETYIPPKLSGAKSQVYINIIIKVDNVAAIQLIVNHDTVLASKDYVNTERDKLIVLLASDSGSSLVGTSTGETVEERLSKGEHLLDIAKKGRNPRYLKIRHVISHEQQRIQQVIDKYNYTFFGQQGLYVDTIDNKLYITYQSISTTNKWVWVVVFDWVTGDYLYRFSTDADGAPEGIAIIHDGNSRYMLLPHFQSSKTFRYTLPLVIPEDTHLIHDAEFSTGSKYQLGNYKNRVAISRDIGGANHGFDYDGNRVDIYSTSGFVSGTLTKYSSLSLDNALQGRSGEKPKRQGLTMGQNSILASVGAYTTTSGYKQSGLYGYIEYNLDGTLKNNAIFSPAEFADKLVAAGYERLKTVENESICLVDEGDHPEIFTCAIGAMGSKTDNERSVIIIQHNCFLDDTAIDMSSSAGANVNFYNDFPSSYHTLNNDNPMSGSLFTKVPDICEFMITYDVSSYTLMNTSEITLDTSARVKIGVGSLITVTSIDKNIFKIEWAGKSQSPGVVTSSVGNIFLRKSENYEITNLSFNLLQNSPMPPFAGEASYAVVGCPLWSPVGDGNGVLLETGYAWNRSLQRFIDTGGNLYIRYTDEATRNTTLGWKKYPNSAI